MKQVQMKEVTAAVSAPLRAEGDLPKAYGDYVYVLDQELRQIYLEQKGIGKLLNDALMFLTAKLTEGFTFAQLNELYVSAALQWHYEQNVDIEKLVKSMKSDLHKGQTMLWMKEETDVRVGFLVS
ncbi:hypothetical protein AB4114_04140 [Paenibacillus sp. 2RAB27]|uniref:hypothetical protein n=1 Tax=Paenibacillus sp. 2RAB27 TaxID=3232991 RepID=UPI003F99F1BE